LSYVNDIVVAIRKKETYISDLIETFANMHKARLKLNPEKCIFGNTKGKVLGCLGSIKDIEANPDKLGLSFKCNHRRAGNTSRSSQVE
jgi:hypothetical protein